MDDTKKGSRGVMIFPGDVLKFGASTRMYIVEGPAEFERGALQAKMQQQKIQRQEQQQLKQMQQEQQSSNITAGGLDAGASSWGIAMSDDENDDDDEDTKAKSSANKVLPMDLQVPEKHRKSLEKLNRMKYKLANLETEDARIQRKGDLTEGQEKQLQRNVEREEALKKSIAELEETLFDKLYPDKAGRTKRTKQSSTMDDPSWEEEDDFFDRTKDSHVSQSIDDNTEAESEATLIVKWKRLFEQQKFRRNSSLPKAHSRLNALQEKFKNLQQSKDEDAFFVQNDLQLAQETLTKIENDMKDCDLSMSEVEKLLRIVNSKLQWNRDTGFIGEGPPPPPPTTTTTPDGFDIPSSMPPPVPSNFMPPPALPKKALAQPPSTLNERKEIQESDAMQSAPISREDDESKTSFEMPAPKRKRVLGPSMPPPSLPPRETSAAKPKVHNPTKHPVAGTLSFLNSARKVTTTNSKTAALTEPKPVGPTKGAATNPQVDVWKAPKDQDGSGKTKLNEKFSGRY